MAPVIALPVLRPTGIKTNTWFRKLFEAATRALVTEVDEELADEETSDDESVDAPPDAGDSDASQNFTKMAIFCDVEMLQYQWAGIKDGI